MTRLMIGFARQFESTLPVRARGIGPSKRCIWTIGFSAAVLLLLSGCAVGPNYQRPPIEAPPSFRGEEEPIAAESLADLPWWDLFRDPALKALISAALIDNYDLRIAARRVEQARYAVGVTRADLLPQVGYEGSAQRGKEFTGFGPNQTLNTFFGAFQMAWEIDLWGRIRRATEASLANLFAAEDVRRGVILELVTDVAQAYFELRELDLELEIALRTRENFQDTLDLFTRQLVGGVGNKLATSRAAAALAEVAASIPELERQIVAKENQLSILLGRAPAAITRGDELYAQTYPPQVPPGIPAGLLERRPDILAAEQDIVAANAIVGVSVANFLPRIGLTALYGGQSTELDDILQGPATVWSIAAGLAGPIFQGGRLYYNYKGSVAVWEETKLIYERAVLTALAEVSNALVSRQKLVLTQIELERQVMALQESVRLSMMRYTGGLADYFEVLEAQQQLFPAELALARARNGELVSVVQLYRALGGGWRAEESAHPEQYPQERELLDAIIPTARTTH